MASKMGSPNCDIGSGVSDGCGVLVGVGVGNTVGVGGDVWMAVGAGINAGAQAVRIIMTDNTLTNDWILQEVILIVMFPSACSQPGAAQPAVRLTSGG
jgi:hypothetical protein